MCLRAASLGWRVSASLKTDFVLDALERAIHARCGTTVSGLVHHSDRGTPYLSMRDSDRLADEGIAPSVGSRGDACTTTRSRSPSLVSSGLRSFTDAARGARWRPSNLRHWSGWRLLEPIGYVPPAEYEARYYEAQAKVA